MQSMNAQTEGKGEVINLKLGKTKVFDKLPKTIQCISLKFHIQRKKLQSLAITKNIVFLKILKHWKKMLFPAN